MPLYLDEKLVQDALENGADVNVAILDLLKQNKGLSYGQAAPVNIQHVDAKILLSLMDRLEELKGFEAAYRSSQIENIRLKKVLWWRETGKPHRGRRRSGEFRFCIDCGLPIYIKRRDIIKYPERGLRCGPCDRKQKIPPNPNPEAGRHYFCNGCGKPCYIQRHRLEKHPDWGTTCRNCHNLAQKRTKWLRESHLLLNILRPLYAISTPMGCHFNGNCRDCKKIFEDDCKIRFGCNNV